MRTVQEISVEELGKRNKAFKALVNEPYVKILYKKKLDLFLSLTYISNKVFDRIPSFYTEKGTKDKMEEISHELRCFQRNKYPELIFELQDKTKLRQVEALKRDKMYMNFIEGMDYFSGEIHSNPNALEEIKELNHQVSELIALEHPLVFEQY